MIKSIQKFDTLLSNRSLPNRSFRVSVRLFSNFTIRTCFRFDLVELIVINFIYSSTTNDTYIVISFN